MTADVVNLRRVRKQKLRADKDRQADQNRVSFGRTKAEKSLTGALNEKAVQKLDQSKRETDKGDDKPTGG